jgi:hypothetical protein
MRLIRSLTAIVVAAVILASSATHAAADRKKSFSGGSGKGRSSSASRSFGKSSGFSSGSSKFRRSTSSGFSGGNKFKSGFSSTGKQSSRSIGSALSRSRSSALKNVSGLSKLGGSKNSGLSKLTGSRGKGSASGIKLPTDGGKTPTIRKPNLGKIGNKLPGGGLKLPGNGSRLPNIGGKLPNPGNKLPGAGGKLPGTGNQLPGFAGRLPGVGGKLLKPGKGLPGNRLPDLGVPKLPGKGEGGGIKLPPIKGGNTPPGNGGVHPPGGTGGKTPGHGSWKPTHLGGGRHGHHHPWFGHWRGHCNWNAWCGIVPRRCHWWYNYCPQIQTCSTSCIAVDYRFVPCQIDGVIVPDTRWYLGVSGMFLPGRGMGVESVDAASPAADVGLAPGMVITAANGFALNEPADLEQAMQSSSGILTLQVVVEENSEPQTVDVLLRRIRSASF